MSNARFFLLVGLWLPLIALAGPSVPTTTFVGHQSPVLAVAFSPDSSQLASVADNGLLKIWSVETGKELLSFPGLKGNRNDVRFTPDGSTVVALGSSNDIVLFDAKNGKALKPIAVTNLIGGVTALDLSPDGKTVAIVGYGTLRLLELSTETVKANYTVHAGHGVATVAFSPNGHQIATAGSDHAALVLDASDGKELHRFDLELPGGMVVFSRDGKELITYAERVVRVFKIESGEGRKLVDKGYPFRTMVMTPDRKSILLGGPGHAPWLASLENGEIQDDLYQADDRVNAAAISANGKLIAGGGNEGPVYLWKTAR